MKTARPKVPLVEGYAQFLLSQIIRKGSVPWSRNFWLHKYSHLPDKSLADKTMELAVLMILIAP